MAPFLFPADRADYPADCADFLIERVRMFRDIYPSKNLRHLRGNLRKSAGNKTLLSIRLLNYLNLWVIGSSFGAGFSIFLKTFCFENKAQYLCPLTRRHTIGNVKWL